MAASSEMFLAIIKKYFVIGFHLVLSNQSRSARYVHEIK